MATKDGTFRQFARAFATYLTAPTVADNSGRELLCDDRGALWVREAAAAGNTNIYQNKFYQNNQSPNLNIMIFGNANTSFDLLEFTGFKINPAATRYIHIFNGSSAPANGTVPRIAIALAGATTTFSLSYPDLPISATPMFVGTTGVAVLSSTPDTLTRDLTATFRVQTLVGQF
jgi:hypothetical protein